MGEDITSYLQSPKVMANVISNIIGQAALSSDWASSFAIPGKVLDRVVSVMEDLCKIKSSADVAALLAGKVNPLLTGSCRLS